MAAWGYSRAPQMRKVLRQKPWCRFFPWCVCPRVWGPFCSLNPNHNPSTNDRLGKRLRAGSYLRTFFLKGKSSSCSRVMMCTRNAGDRLGSVKASWSNLYNCFECSISNLSVQEQLGQGFEQPYLEEGIPAHGRRPGTRWSRLQRSLPNNLTILSFYESSVFILFTISL